MKPNKKHILFLPRWYPNKLDPMWGLFVRKHAEAASIENQVSVFYMEALDIGVTNDQIIQKEEHQLYTLYIYYKKPKNKLLYFLKFLQVYIHGFSLINKKNKVDLIHVHVLSRMGFLALLTKKIKKIPYVITEHWSRYLPASNTYNGWLRKRMTEKVVSQAKCVMPVTTNLQKAMLSYNLHNKNYKIVANVVDHLFYQSPILIKTKEIKRVIHVSTFINSSKNISGLLKGLKEVLVQRSDFKLILIGEGINFNEMMDLSNELQIDKNNIEFTGLLEKEALVDQFSKADFLIINSHYENMPVVINEAFACGLPVLSTNVGGISEHLNVNFGKLMPVNNDKEFMNSFIWMLDHCREFDVDAIREYANTHFSYSGVGKVLDGIYSEAINS